MVRQMRILLAASLMMICCVSTIIAQSIRGRLIDADTDEPLIGASVVVKGTTNGTVTDVDGNFEFKISQNKATLVFSYIGYMDKTLKLTNTRLNLGVISLKADVVTMNDVVVTSSIAISRKTPVALSTIDPVFIAEKIGTKEFPEILKSTPGVYATKSGGGFGDSKINMRGFKAANVAVMVNGVPMNDMEWGGLYWSNWAGLSDVTRSMQTQRGLGASKVSSPSVGGSINIVTRSIDAKKGGAISYGMGNDGLNTLLFSVSTGLNEKGWAMTLLGGKKWGDGYIQGANFEGYNYFLNISKRINDAHQLSFTAFGAPQTHYQRSRYDGLTVQGWQDVKRYMGSDSPYKYNATYGFDKSGKQRSSAYNSYHKPQISLNHQWQINDKSSLSTSLYASIGRGFGNKGIGTSAYSSSWFGTSNGVLNTTFRKADGTFAYDEIQDLNEQSQNGSLMAMAISRNEHNWYGLVSTYTTKLSETIDFYGGVDLRYYKGIHTTEISDLYNGDYYIDTYYRPNIDSKNRAEAANPAFLNKKLGIGDIVYRDYDGFVMQEGGFAQAEYNKDKLSVFVSGSLSNTSYWRYDRYYYDAAHAESERVNFIGYTFKGGFNFNLNENHNVFANVGYISRAPFFKDGAFMKNSNQTNPDAVNEKVFSAEVGYGFKNRYIKFNVNAYYTKWSDKTMAKSSDYSYVETITPAVPATATTPAIPAVTADRNDRWTVNMSGINARHMGVEMDFQAKPYSWLTLTGMLSVGDWQWDSNATGYFYNSAGQPLADMNGTVASGLQSADHLKTTVMLKGVKVGGSAQTTGALGARVKLMKGLSVAIDYNYFARNFADFDIKADDIAAGKNLTFTDPWKIPSGSQIDISAKYNFQIGGLFSTFYANVDNIMDTHYIVDAYDGGNGEWQSANRLFYSFGRTYSVRLKVRF